MFLFCFRPSWSTKLDGLLTASKQEGETENVAGEVLVLPGAWATCSEDVGKSRTLNLNRGSDFKSLNSI